MNSIEREATELSGPDLSAHRFGGSQSRKFQTPGVAITVNLACAGSRRHKKS